MTSDTEWPSDASNADTAPGGSAEGWLAGGGAIGALLASTCCVLPAVLFALGIGGAWIGELTALAPYKPWFWTAGALCVAAGLISPWRGRRACSLDGRCRPSRGLRIAHAVLWLAAALLVVSALWRFIVPFLLG